MTRLRFKLYRNLRRTAIVAVTAAVFTVGHFPGQFAFGQAFSRDKKPVKEPRAVGVLQFMPGGKARLTPVAIMIDGVFYDAAAYKAAPVPMAIETGTVYEGFRDGVSQGLFQVTRALSGPNNQWLADGTWQTSAELAAKKEKKPASVIPRGMEDTDAPPTLRRETASKKDPQPVAPPATTTAAAAPPKADDSKPSPVPQVAKPNPDTQPTQDSKPAVPPTAAAPELKRGKPATQETAQDVVAIPPPGKKTDVPPTSKVTAVDARAPAPAPSTASPAEPQMMPAVSEEHGPDPHSYEYPLKAGEEASLMKKMLALATKDISTHSQKIAPPDQQLKPSSRRGKAVPKIRQPPFSDVKMKIFDLSSSNEPTLILSAKASVPSSEGAAEHQSMVTLIAHEDVYGDLHEAFSSVTDADHLDLTPRMTLIDAVDVDGDGRGELLFRLSYDQGSAFVIYRVIGQQLYPLFQGSPSS